MAARAPTAAYTRAAAHTRDGGTAAAAPHSPSGHGEADADAQRALVIRTLLGLLALLGLTYLGGHPIVRLWERRLGISQVITAGFPFVLLGLAAGSSKIGVLSEKVLEMIDPVLSMSLGWIGLIIGFRFEASVLASSQKIARLLTTRVLLSSLCIVTSTAVVLLGVSGFTLQAVLSLEFLRDALILGSAGALMSLITPQLLAARGCDDESIRTIGKLVRLQELMGIIGLLFIAAYFRPESGTITWVLPGTAWLLLTLGLGTGVGIVMYAVLAARDRGSRRGHGPPTRLGGIFRRHGGEPGAVPGGRLLHRRRPPIEPSRRLQAPCSRHPAPPGASDLSAVPVDRGRQVAD